MPHRAVVANENSPAPYGVGLFLSGRRQWRRFAPCVGDALS